MSLLFTIAAGPRQRSHSQVRVQRDSWPHFTVSDSSLPQPGRPGPSIYNPQEQSGPVTPQGTGLNFILSLSLMLRPTGSRSVYLGIKHPSGFYDQIFVTVKQLRFCWCERCLWREDGSVVYNSNWPSPAQSFSRPSPVGLTAWAMARLHVRKLLQTFKSLVDGEF
jgi:hypothetical protein